MTKLLESHIVRLIATLYRKLFVFHFAVLSKVYSKRKRKKRRKKKKKEISMEGNVKMLHCIDSSILRAQHKGHREGPVENAQTPVSSLTFHFPIRESPIDCFGV